MLELRKKLFVLCAFLLLALGSKAYASLPDFTELAEKSSPAVVNISTRYKAEQQSGRHQFMFPDLDGVPPIFREFFQHPFAEPRFPNNRPRSQRESRSLGSGFIISADGYILTNNHVVEGADEIIVRLADRSELVAELVGTDARSDVALLKVEADNLPTLQMGRSSDLKVGEWVLAIGSPFGFDHSVTAGIVSAKGRSLPNESYVPFIQTDVAINPGNSGGPLFNLNGEVVGINSQIFTRSGGFMGLSFAIPVEVAMGVVEQLKETGTVERGWLGVSIQEVNKELAESFNLDKPSGALVAQVFSGSPAEKAGLQVGDVIIATNGQPVVMSADLPHLIGAMKPGQVADLQVVRSGKRKHIKVEVGAVPADDEQQTVKSGKPSIKNKLGLQVSDLTQEQKNSLEVKKGVLVSQVQGGTASLIGLRKGDVITHLNGQEVASAQEFNAMVDKLPSERSLSMRVLRQGRASFITFRIGG